MDIALGIALVLAIDMRRYGFWRWLLVTLLIVGYGIASNHAGHQKAAERLHNIINESASTIDFGDI